jgi:hypothetical protein
MSVAKCGRALPYGDNPYGKESTEKERNRIAGCQRFSRPRATLRPLVANHEHFAFPVIFVLDRPEARFLPVKARRHSKFQVRHPRNLNNRASRREVASEPGDAADGGARLVDGMDHTLVLIPLLLHALGDGTSPDRHAPTAELAVAEQSAHQERNAATLEQIFGDITAGWLQIRAFTGNSATRP